MKTPMTGLVIAAGLPMAVLTLFSFLGPVLVYADAATHFRLHFGVLLIAAAGVLLLRRRWWIAALFLMAGAVGSGSVLAWIAAATPVPVAPDAAPVRLFSFNLSFYNSRLEEVLARIAEAEPDLIYLVEVSERNHPVISALAPTYSVAVSCGGRFRGRAILVSPRFAGTGETGCIGTSIAWAAMQLDGRPLTLMSVHLRWPAPFGQPEDIEALEQSFAARRDTMIVAGDFNAAPWSEAVARVAAATRTTLVPGYRASWAPPGTPSWLLDWIGLPIDHVLLPEHAGARAIRTLRPAGSDHKPVLTDILLE